MKKETTIKAATVEEAVQQAVEEMGVSRDACQIEVLEAPKKTLFGKLKNAVVKVTAEIPEPVLEKKAEPEKKVEPEKKAAAPETAKDAPPDIKKCSPEEIQKKVAAAQEYLQKIFQGMGLDTITMTTKETDVNTIITLNGDGIAVLIGHHGETLDALQYLATLTANRLGGDYYRIMLDCGNYRGKREETLRDLAARIAKKVKRTGRSQILEPMNPYERRIIHSVVTDIEGVTSKSKGEEPNRRVVITSEHPVKTNNYHRGNGHSGDVPQRRYQPHERTMEEILKSDFKEKEEKAELYSKIEL